MPEKPLLQPSARVADAKRPCPIVSYRKAAHDEHEKSLLQLGGHQPGRPSTPMQTTLPDFLRLHMMNMKNLYCNWAFISQGGLPHRCKRHCPIFSCRKAANDEHDDHGADTEKK